jgi:hypothetical protein
MFPLYKQQLSYFGNIMPNTGIINVGILKTKILFKYSRYACSCELLFEKKPMSLMESKKARDELAANLGISC